MDVPTLLTLLGFLLALGFATAGSLRALAPALWWLGTAAGLALLAYARLLPGAAAFPLGRAAAVPLAVAAVGVAGVLAGATLAWGRRPLPWRAVGLAMAGLSLCGLAVAATLLAAPLPVPVAPPVLLTGLGAGLATVAVAGALAPAPPWLWWPAASFGAVLATMGQVAAPGGAHVMPVLLALMGHAAVTGAAATAYGLRHDSAPADTAADQSRAVTTAAMGALLAVGGFVWAV